MLSSFVALPLVQRSSPSLVAAGVRSLQRTQVQGQLCETHSFSKSTASLQKGRGQEHSFNKPLEFCAADPCSNAEAAKGTRRAQQRTEWPPPVTPPRQPRLPKVNQPTFLFCAIPHQLNVPAAFQNFHSIHYAVYFVTDFHSIAVTSHILDAGVLVVPEASHLNYLNSVFADGGHLALSSQEP